MNGKESSDGRETEKYISQPSPVTLLAVIDESM